MYSVLFSNSVIGFLVGFLTGLILLPQPWSTLWLIQSLAIGFFAFILNSSWGWLTVNEAINQDKSSKVLKFIPWAILVFFAYGLISVFFKTYLFPQPVSVFNWEFAQSTTTIHLVLGYIGFFTNFSTQDQNLQSGNPNKYFQKSYVKTEKIISRFISNDLLRFLISFLTIMLAPFYISITITYLSWLFIDPSSEIEFIVFLILPTLIMGILLATFRKDPDLAIQIIGLGAFLFISISLSIFHYEDLQIFQWPIFVTIILTYSFSIFDLEALDYKDESNDIETNKESDFSLLSHIPFKLFGYVFNLFQRLFQKLSNGLKLWDGVWGLYFFMTGILFARINGNGPGFSVILGLLFYLTISFLYIMASSFTPSYIIKLEMLTPPAYFRSKGVLIWFKVLKILPYFFKRFLQVTNQALLIKTKGQTIEFRHRIIRDYFATQNIIPLLEKKGSRAEVAFELGKMKDASCDILIELANDEDSLVRSACIDCLAKIGTPIATQTLINHYKESGRGEQKIILDVLEHLRDFSSIQILKRFWEENQDDQNLEEKLVELFGIRNRLDEFFDEATLERLLEGNRHSYLKCPIITALFRHNSNDYSRIIAILDKYKPNRLNSYSNSYNSRKDSYEFDYGPDILLLPTETRTPVLYHLINYEGLWRDWAIKNIRILNALGKLEHSKVSNTPSPFNLNSLFKREGEVNDTIEKNLKTNNRDNIIEALNSISVSNNLRKYKGLLIGKLLDCEDLEIRDVIVSHFVNSRKPYYLSLFFESAKKEEKLDSSLFKAISKLNSVKSYSDKRVASRLGEIIKDGDSSTWGKAAWMFENMGNPENATAVAPLLKDSSLKKYSEEFYEIIQCLCSLKNPKTILSLIDILIDPLVKKETRIQCLELIASHYPEELEPYIEQLLLESKPVLSSFISNILPHSAILHSFIEERIIKFNEICEMPEKKIRLEKQINILQEIGKIKHKDTYELLQAIIKNRSKIPSEEAKLIITVIKILFQYSNSGVFATFASLLTQNREREEYFEPIGRLLGELPTNNFSPRLLLESKFSKDINIIRKSLERAGAEKRFEIAENKLIVLLLSSSYEEKLVNDMISRNYFYYPVKNALEIIGKENLSPDEIAEFLKSPNPSSKVLILDYIDNNINKEIEDLLLQNIYSPDEMVSTSSLKKYVSLNHDSPKLQEKLVAFILDEKVIGRKYAIKLMLEFFDESFLEKELFKSFNSSKTSREQFLYYLSLQRKTNYMSELKDHLFNNDPEIRYCSTLGLGIVRDGSYVDEIGKLLVDESRLYNRYLDFPHWEVRQGAEEALQNIGTPKAKKILDLHNQGLS